jgi:hypothetical protein
MTKPYIRIILAVCLFCSSFALAGQGISVTDSVKVTQDDQKVIVSLLKVHLETVASQKNRNNKEDFKVELSIIGVGEGYRIGAKKVVNGKDVFFAQVVSASENDLDRAVERLARSIVREKDEPEVDTLTAREEKNVDRKRKTYNRFIFGFGPAFAWGLGDSGPLYNMRIGYNWESAESRLGISYDRSASLSDEKSYEVEWDNIGLSADWIATPGEISPFFGGDFCYGTARIDYVGRERDADDKSLRGFSIGLRGGYLFFRTAMAQASASCFVRPSWGKLQTKNFGITGCGAAIEF